MGDKWFPSSIKPLVNKTYSLSRGTNVMQSKVDGGMPRFNLDRTLEPVPFTLNFVMSDFHYGVFLSFYDGAINHGGDSFKMNLDSGTGITEHQVNILPNTLKASKPAGCNWYVGFTALAEVTPSQLEACDALYNLYQCYGDQSAALIQSFEDFVVGLPSA